MPRRKEQFVTGEIYHIVIRAIDNNLIFKDLNDYYRGIFSIYEFNNAIPVNIFNRRLARTAEKKKEKFCELGAHKILVENIRGRVMFFKTNLNRFMWIQIISL